MMKLVEELRMTGIQEKISMSLGSKLPKDTKTQMMDPFTALHKMKNVLTHNSITVNDVMSLSVAEVERERLPLTELLILIQLE